MIKTLVLIVLGVYLYSSPAVAQQLQNKDVFHPSVALNENWYATTWLIGNVRQDLPDNLNLFPGIGYKTDRWWIEALGWKHWSKTGNRTAVETRFGITHPDFSFYSELGRFFKNGDVYLFVISERPVTSRLKLGAETENFFRRNTSLGGGPRVSYGLGSWLNGPASVALAYQVRHRESDVVRVYFAIHPRF